ncbi:hypothetical protein D3C72_2091030 [compost metagenome]
MGAQLSEHLALNPPFFAADRLAFTVNIRRAVRCLLALNPPLLTGAQALRYLGGHLATAGCRQASNQPGELVIKGL